MIRQDQRTKVTMREENNKDREQREMRQCTNGTDKEKAKTRRDEMRQD